MTKEKREIFSWALYDWANSAFATTVVAGFFPLFFKAYWANSANPTESTFYLGIANSTASILVALFAPFLGAIADRSSARKKFLMFFAFLGIVMGLGLGLVAKGQWQYAIFFFIVATVGWSGANIFYDSLLPAISKKDNVDEVSSLGYALGYVGGGLLFAVNVIMYLKPHLFGIPDGATAVKLSFVTVAVWWFVFSLPVFIIVKEPKMSGTISVGNAVIAGWRQLITTLYDIKYYKVIATFLVAYWLYIDGVDTIVRMAVDYGMSLGFSSASLMISLLIVQFVAFPASLFHGYLSQRIGVKPALFITILGYILITCLGYFMQFEWHFYMLAVMVGLFQGGIQALSRSLYTRIIPHDKAAEFFGFYNMLGKFAAVLGPVMMGGFSYLTGNVRFGILSIIVLFIGGAFLLLKTDIAEGERVARAHRSN